MNVQKDGKEPTTTEKTVIYTVAGLLVTATAIGGAIIGVNLANLVNGK